MDDELIEFLETKFRQLEERLMLYVGSKKEEPKSVVTTEILKHEIKFLMDELSKQTELTKELEKKTLTASTGIADAYRRQLEEHYQNMVIPKVVAEVREQYQKQLNQILNDNLVSPINQYIKNTNEAIQAMNSKIEILLKDIETRKTESILREKRINKLLEKLKEQSYV